jgi:Rne/Rng family ribonuclease
VILEPLVETAPESEAEGEGQEAEAEAEGEGQIEAQGEEGSESTESPVEVASATVRDQGQRYPHRVSRRMRRKQRGGGQPGDESGRPASQERTVAPRDENAPSDVPAAAQGEAPDQERERGPRERVERERPPLPSISDLLKEGQEIVVQIAKEPLGQKGARITSHIALPGRFVVYMPTVEHVGVSRKIPSDEERQRLKRVLQTHRQGVPGGFICRTAAEGKTEEELKADMHFLYNLWLDMRQKAERKPAPVLLHHDLDLVQRILRDQLTTSFKTIWVDNEEIYESVLRFVQRFQPALVGRVKLYTRANPIFDEFGITAEVEKALRPKVWLKSGGYIVINQTEALVAIDINTGKYVGKSNRLEDTIVKINSDAIKEIVRQIRLRDLGGIIVVDFIDMDERKNRQKVMLALEEGMRADRAPYKILQFNDFGLVAITRKRVKQSLERTLCAPCAYCEGAGYIKSPATVVSEILQEAQRMQKALAAETGNVVLRVNPEVAKLLKSNQNSYLQEIEEIAGRTVMVKSDPLLHQTKFDLA